jgi:two-component system, OmpR family, heavy metal sensor histidine kinase CusS
VIRSFRIRLALASAVLAGSALIGFGMTSWWLIYQAKVSRLDEAIESQLMRANRPLRRFPPSPRRFSIDENTPTAILITDLEGKILYKSDNWSNEINVTNFWRLPDGTNPIPIELQPNLARPRLGVVSPPRFFTQRTSTETWRIGAATFPSNQIAIAISLETIDGEMVAIGNILLISIFIVLILITGGAWWLSGNALRPIGQLTEAIKQVTVKGLDRRVPIGATDVEFVELIAVFNQMLENLERSFKQASRFSGDAAHELKTPLAILQGELERNLQSAEPESQMQQSLSSLLDEVRRLSGIVRKLLLLSLADAGRMNLHKIEVNLSEILAQVEEDIELLAPQLKVETEIKAQLQVMGDRDLLIQVVQNLVSNAIKYNLPDGWIRIYAKQQGTKVLITITNASKNILQGDRERIFERFYRGDPARTRSDEVEGTGLGLSLAREIARAHGGDLILDSTPSNQTAFTLHLPALKRDVTLN